MEEVYSHKSKKKMAIRFGSMKDINIPIIYLLYVCMCSISNIGGYFFFSFPFFLVKGWFNLVFGMVLVENVLHILLLYTDIHW